MKIIKFDFLDYEVGVPAKMWERLCKKYRIKTPDHNLLKFARAWFVEDFGIDLFMTNDEHKFRLIPEIIFSRFYRLYPLFAVMDAVPEDKQLALWCVEHMEKDLHRRNELHELLNAKPSPKRDLKILSYVGVDMEEILKDYIKDTFTE